MSPAFQSWAQRAPPPLGMRTKNHALTILCSSPLKAWKVIVIWTDATMPLFNIISIRPTPEIDLSSTINYKLQEVK